MKSTKFSGLAFALFLAVAFLATACGTLQIDTEPFVPETEVAESAIEETTVTDEVTPVPVAASAEARTEAEDVAEVVEPPVQSSEITELDETWNQLTDYRLGFSIKFPKQMATFRGSCTWNEDEGSYRPEIALVPVKIFEDTGAVYIAAEYYYDLGGERQVGSRAYFDECNQVTNSLELLQDPDVFNEPYWELVFEDVHDDAELDRFIKERYGPNCSAGEQLPSVQNGVYDIKIQGNGERQTESQCLLNYVTVVKYFPEGDRLVAWDRGQASHFPADASYSVVHDQEMEDSFRFLTESSTETGGDLLSYTNPEYGFTLHYPSTWVVEEVNDVDFVGPGSRSVQLSQGTITLVIGYRRAGEEVALSGSGAPAGEFEIRGTTRMLGQDVDRYVIVYEGKDKVVMYGEPGTGPLALGGQEFSARLNDFNPDYDSVELSQRIQDEADMILSSLAIVEVEGAEDQATDAADYDYSGWQSYSNETVGYTLMVPDEADVMGANRAAAVEFVGPFVGDEHWPWFMVQHFDSEFFRPPAGTDVRQWIADSDSPYKATARETTIGGLPAVRLQVAASQQAYGMDEYYVIAGDQLFKITILHAGGLQDWDLYDQFLASITFLDV